MPKRMIMSFISTCLMEEMELEGLNESELVKLYDEHWERVKKDIQTFYYVKAEDGSIIKPAPNNMLSLKKKILMFYGNHIYDIDMALANEKRYEDRISFDKDCLEIFDLQGKKRKRVSIT